MQVTGKGGRQRVVPVDAAFFIELAAYLRTERPASCRTAECFVVLRGPTAGVPRTEAGLRRIFCSNRASASRSKTDQEADGPSRRSAGWAGPGNLPTMHAVVYHREWH